MGLHTVFVVDDQEVFRNAATAVIDATEGFVTADVWDDGPEAVAYLLDQRCLPDLILMDIHLGTSSGIDLTRELVAARPEACVVLFSTMSSEDMSAAVEQCGASGYIPKSQLSPASLAASFLRRHDD